MSSAVQDSSGQILAEGEKIAGKYRVECVLGSGGMGVVYAARHEDLGQLFAIKFLRPGMSERRSPDTLVSRFVREARAAAQIQSDYVVRVFDVGTLENGDAYMVMEHLGGQDLDRLLGQTGSLNAEQAANYVMEALDALAHAHALGIVHRDLKPSNLFVTDRPDGTKRIKVLDFGISKMRSELDRPLSGKALTTGDAVLGSPGYMAPEQVRKSKNADVRSDIWSIGVILYELLTGVQPFRGDTVGEILAAILDGSMEPPSKLQPGIPQGLEAIVMKCLLRNPAERFSDVAALSGALSVYCDESHREIARRIEAVLKGANSDAKADGMVRVSLSPNSDRVSQTAETMDAIVSAQAAADMPRLEPITLSASFVGGRESSQPSQDVPKKRGRPMWVWGAGLSLGLALIGGIAFFGMFGRGQEPEGHVQGAKVQGGIATEPLQPALQPPAVQSSAALTPEIKPAAELSAQGPKEQPSSAASLSAGAPSSSAPLKNDKKSGVQGSKPRPSSAVPTDLLRERD